MKLTIESTGVLATVDGVRCRTWKGKTESGIEVIVLVHRMMVPAAVDQEPFERELTEQVSPVVQSFVLHEKLNFSTRIPNSLQPTRCDACDGSGDCDHCDGQGCNRFGYECTLCKGTGKCPECNGVTFTFGKD